MLTVSRWSSVGASWRACDNGGARGIRTLDPSYPGYRISSSCQGGPRTSVVVHPELTGSPIDAFPSTGIRPRPARWGSRWVRKRQSWQQSYRHDRKPEAGITTRRPGASRLVGERVRHQPRRLIDAGPDRSRARRFQPGGDRLHLKFASIRPEVGGGSDPVPNGVIVMTWEAHRARRRCGALGVLIGWPLPQLTSSAPRSRLWPTPPSVSPTRTRSQRSPPPAARHSPPDGGDDSVALTPESIKGTLVPAGRAGTDDRSGSQRSARRRAALRPLDDPVQFPFDSLVALACGRFEAGAVNDGDVAAVVPDQTGRLKDPRG
jgi:hypothetical protein